MSMQPGWYPDPFSSGGYVRWWDGQRWGASAAAPTPAPEAAATAETAPAGPAAPSSDPWTSPVPPTAPPAYQQQYGAPAYPGYGAPVATFPVAQYGSRVAAQLIDWLIEAIVLLPLTLWLLWPAVSDFIDAIPTDGSTMSQSALVDFQSKVVSLSLWLSLISVVVTFLYVVPQNVRWGRTVGKRVMGIRIRPLAADVPLTWGQATIRWGTYTLGVLAIGGFFTLIDYLWPLWDKPWRQALHDKTAKTVVVPTR